MESAKRSTAVAQRQEATHIDNASNVTLDRSTRQKQVDLVIIVSEALEILDDTEAALAIRDGCVVIILLTVFVNRKTLSSGQYRTSSRAEQYPHFKIDGSARTKLWLNRARYIDWRFATDHTKFSLAVLDDLEVDGDNAGNLDGTTEGYLG